MKEKCIPVVTIGELAKTHGVLSALRRSGYVCAEITFRTPCAAQALAYAVQNFPELTIGAGTIVQANQCRTAIGSGAKFIVSPGLSASVAAVCREAGIPYYPGCVTPSEIMAALELGITTVKFFPANVYGGLTAMKALSAPFPQIKFIPTGGINDEQLQSYLAWEKVVAVGGTCFTKEAVRNG